MNNFDYIPLDKAVIEENVKEFEQNRKMVLSKVRFDNGFDNSIINLHFVNEILLWNDSKVNIRHVVFNVACECLENHFNHMSDNQYRKVLEVVNRWSKAFKCAYDHSSSVNFSWAFRELMKEVKPFIE